MEFKFIQNFTASQYYTQVMQYRKEFLFSGTNEYSPKDDLAEDEQSQHFAAFDEDKLAGYVRLAVQNNIGKLSRIFVYEGYSGKGVGKAMISELISYCKNTNIQQLLLYSRQNAVGFYNKLGFTQTGKETVSPTSGLKLCEMMLQI